MDLAFRVFIWSIAACTLSLADEHEKTLVIHARRVGEPETNAENSQLERRVSSSSSAGHRPHFGLRKMDTIQSASVCGRRLVRREGRNPKILNGRVSGPGEFPWQISLQMRNKYEYEEWQWTHICGASLISKTAALSAAHCFTDHLVDYRLVVGTNSLNGTGFSQQIFNLEEGDFVSHRGFRLHHEWDNDIAFIRLRGFDEKGVDFNRFIQPICLPHSGTYFPPESALCYVSGWGAADKQHPNKISPLLQGARVPLNSADVCEAAYDDKDYRDNYLRRILFPLRKKISVITEGNFCAGYVGSDLDYTNVDVPDSCNGDSGGPLACSLPEQPDVFYLIGIVSWGKECGSKKFPGIYTKVAHYIKWIENEISLSRSDA